MDKFSDFFAKYLPNFYYKNLSKFNSANLELKTSNLFIGTISQVMELFGSEILNPKEIRSLFFDDLDFALSLGVKNNLTRWISFLKHKDIHLLEKIFIQINVSDDETNEMKKFKEKLGLKFTNIRILPEETEEESEQEEAYQMTKKQTEKLLKKKNSAKILQELLHQYYYSNAQNNVYSMIYVLLKYKIFPKRTLIIVSDINDAYR